MINQSELVKLIDRLDRYPVGLPDSPFIRQFFDKYLTEAEIEIASAFPHHEVTLEEICKIVNKEVSAVLPILESLADKGTVVDYKIEDKKHFWVLTPSIIGFVEFSLMKERTNVDQKDIAELIKKYESTLFHEVFGSKTQLTRVMLNMDVPTDSTVRPLSEIEEIVRKAGGGTVQQCYCRNKQELLGQKCEVIDDKEVCFTISKVGSDFLIRRGYGKWISADEIIERVRALGKKGLIHVTDNIRNDPSFICNCCHCCCGLLGGINEYHKQHAVNTSEYIISVDDNKCNNCGACTKKCQIHALSFKDKKLEVDFDNCLGCGACVQFCKKEALSLKVRKKKPFIPRNMTLLYLTLLKEKNKLLQFLSKLFVDRIKQLFR